MNQDMGVATSTFQVVYVGFCLMNMWFKIDFFSTLSAHGKLQEKMEMYAYSN